MKKFGQAAAATESDKDARETSKSKQYAPSKWQPDMGNTSAVLVNAKAIPIELVLPDDQNPRQFLTTFEQFQNAPKMPVIDEMEGEGWNGYINELEEYSTSKAMFAELVGIAELAVTISSPEKLGKPIATYSEGNSFRLLDGYRRFLSHIMRGFPVIKSTIQDRPDDDEIRVMQWCLNEQHEKLDLAGRVRNFRLIHSAIRSKNPTDASIRKLAARMGRSNTVIARLKSISEDDSDLYRAAIEQRLITDEVLAHDVAQMDEPIKTRLLEYVHSDGVLSRANLKTVIKKLTEEQSPANKPDSASNAYGLKLTSKVKHEPIAKILSAAVQQPELAHLASKIKDINISTREGLVEAWGIVYRELSE
tara:strand:- start:23 stop:1111 length:1089 start_codon:yes stop_codon:yes gene_type:complete